MLTKNLPAAQPSRVIQCGNPWHGLVESSTLTTTEGSIERAWPVQPDSSDAFLFKVAGLDTPTTTSEQAALGMEWRNTAILSGWWNRQLYGQPIPGGNMSRVFNADGISYLVDASGLTLVSGSPTKLSGSIKLTPLVVSDPEIDSVTLTLADLTLNGSNNTIMDVLAIKQDGSEIVLGIWHGQHDGGDVQYSETDETRGMAMLNLYSIDYRVPPWSLIKIAVTTSSVTATEWKGPSATDAVTNSTSTTLGDLIIFWTDSTGEGYVCGFDTECPVDADSCSNPLYDYCPASTSSSSTTDSITTIVGEYYKTTGTAALIDLTVSYDKTSSGTGYGVSADCDDPTDTAIAGETHSISGTFSASLRIDGSAKSSVSVTFDQTTEVERYVLKDGVVSSSNTESVSLSIDGTTILTDEAIAPINGLTTNRINAVAIAGTVKLHVVRYSNNAYGLMLTGLPGTNTAYLGGVVNVVSGTREAAVGYLTSPNDTIEYPFTSIVVSVEPESGDIVENGHTQTCYV